MLFIIIIIIINTKTQEKQKTNYISCKRKKNESFNKKSYVEINLYKKTVLFFIIVYYFFLFFLTYGKLSL